MSVALGERTWARALRLRSRVGVADADARVRAAARDGGVETSFSPPLAGAALVGYVPDPLSVLPASPSTCPAAPKRVRRKDPGVRLQGGRIYDSANGTTCHQCRQKTAEVKAACTRCPMHFCPRCLENRYSERVEEVNATGTWECPKCRKECNCSNCRKKQGLQATGILATIAKRAGFGSVSALLQANPRAVAPSEALRKRTKEGAAAAQATGASQNPVLQGSGVGQGLALQGAGAVRGLPLSGALASLAGSLGSSLAGAPAAEGALAWAPSATVAALGSEEESESEPSGSDASTSSEPSSSSDDDEASTSGKENAEGNEPADVAALAAARFGNVRLTRGMRAAVTERKKENGGKRESHEKKRGRGAVGTASETKSPKEPKEGRKEKRSRAAGGKAGARGATVPSAGEKKRQRSSQPTLPETLASPPCSQPLVDAFAPSLPSSRPASFAQSLSRDLSETLGAERTLFGPPASQQTGLTPELSQLAAFSLSTAAPTATLPQAFPGAGLLSSSQPSDPLALPCGEPLDLSQRSSRTPLAGQLSGSLLPSRAGSQSSHAVQRAEPRLRDAELGERPGPAPARLGIWGVERREGTCEGEERVAPKAGKATGKGGKKGTTKGSSTPATWSLVVGSREVGEGTGDVGAVRALAHRASPPSAFRARLPTPAPTTPPLKGSSLLAATSPDEPQTTPADGSAACLAPGDVPDDGTQSDLVESLAFFECFEAALGLGAPGGGLDLADLASAVVYRGGKPRLVHDRENGLGAGDADGVEDRTNGEESGRAARTTRSRTGARTGGAKASTPDVSETTLPLVPPSHILDAAQKAHEALLALTDLDDESDDEGADEGSSDGGAASDDEALGDEESRSAVSPSADGRAAASPIPLARSVAASRESRADEAAAALAKDAAARTWHAMALRAALLAGDADVQSSVLEALEDAGLVLSAGARPPPLASSVSRPPRSRTLSPTADASGLPLSLSAYWLLAPCVRAAILSLLVHVSLDADEIRGAVDEALAEAQSRAAARRAFEAARRAEARKRALEARDRHLALLVAGLVGPASPSTAHAAPLALTLERQRDLAAEAARLASAAAGRLPPPTPAEARRFAEPEALRLRCLGTDRDGRRFHPLSHRVQNIFAGAAGGGAAGDTASGSPRFDRAAHVAALDPPSRGTRAALWCAPVATLRSWLDERGEREGALVDALERRCGVEPGAGARGSAKPSGALPPRPQPPGAQKRLSKPISKAASRSVSKPTSKAASKAPSRGASRSASPTRAPKKRGAACAA